MSQTQEKENGQVSLSFHKAGCKPFFKKYPASRKLAAKKISQAISREIITGLAKCKLAVRDRVQGLPCYEMRLNLGKQAGSVRLAFTVADGQAVVYFISTDLQKSSFTNEVQRFLKGAGLCD